MHARASACKGLSLIHTILYNIIRRNIWLSLSIHIIGRRVGSFVWSLFILLPWIILLTSNTLNPVLMQVECLIKHLFLPINRYLVHTISNLGLLISVYRDTVIVLLIRVSAHQLAYVLVDLTRCHVVITRVNTIELIRKCYHLVLLLANFKRLCSLFTVVQIV